jgi:chlorobactene glucosyltransferase
MVVYQFFITSLLLLLAVNFLLNWFYFRKPRSCFQQGQKELSLVSVLIPARNEESRIPACLESLLAQSYTRIEILILNDHSTDRTGAIVQDFSRRDARVRLIQGTELAAGWTGKGWACQQLGEQAQGDWLLFTDADTVHDSLTVASALQEACDQQTDLLSLWPRQMALTWSEILVIPFVHVLLLVFLPHWMPGRFRSLGAANGQFLFFRREAYQLIGGHAVVKGHLVDDVALAREIKCHGLRLANRDGSDLVQCRMYENALQLWEGFTKNLRAGCEGSLVGFLLLLGIQLLVLTMPFFLLLGIPWFPRMLPWISFQILLILLLRLALALKCQQPLLSVFLHPLGQLLVILIALNSWLKTARGAVMWKGRHYSG